MRQLTGSWSSKYFRTKANTAYAKGDGVYSDATDIVTTTTTTPTFLGIVDETKASANNNNRIKVLVPSSKRCTFSVAATAATAAYEGRRVDFSSATAVDISATTYKAVTIVKFISATELEVSANDGIA